MNTAALAAVALMALSAPGLAAAAEAPLARAVAYADLNLNDARDAQVMLHRIRKAAVAACRTGGNDFESGQRFEACRADTVARAVAALAAPQVTAAYTASHPTQAVASR